MKKISKPKTNGKFRLNCQNVMLTYPHSMMSKDILLYELKRKFPFIDEYLIAEEKHEDGTPHLHAFFHSSKKLDIKTARALDIRGEHGNYQNPDSKVAWIAYCLKEDTNPLADRDWDKWVKETNAHAAHKGTEKNLKFLAQLQEVGPKKMVELGQLSVMNFQKAMANFDAFKKAGFEDSRGPLPSSIPNPWEADFRVDMDLKKCHLWIFSRKPNLGKTTWATALLCGIRAEAWNYQEKFQPQFRCSTEMVILDEYRGQLKVTELNQLCDGMYYFTAKNALSWKLDNKPMVVVLSNRSIADLYKKEEDQELIEARFIEKEITVFRQD